MRVTLTDDNVVTLPAPPSGRCAYWDTETPGFGLRVTSNNWRTFWLRFTARDRRKAWLLLGRLGVFTLADARSAAKAALAAVSRGEDPRAAKRLARPLTVREAVRTYLDSRTRISLRTGHNYEWAARRIWSSPIANRPVDTLRRADVRALVDSIATPSAIRTRSATVTLVLSLLRASLRWSTSRGAIVDTNLLRWEWWQPLAPRQTRL